MQGEPGTSLGWYQPGGKVQLCLWNQEILNSRVLPVVLGTPLPGGIANSEVGEGFKLWGFPLLGYKLYSWVMMGMLGDSSVGPCDLLQLCPAGALDGRCAGEGIPGTSRLQLLICRSTSAILLSSMANGNVPKWRCRNNLELKAAFVHSLIEKLPFSPDTLQPLSRSYILILPTINPLF